MEDEGSPVDRLDYEVSELTSHPVADNYCDDNDNMTTETVVIMSKTFTESIQPDQEFIPIIDDVKQTSLPDGASNPGNASTETKEESLVAHFLPDPVENNGNGSALRPEIENSVEKSDNTESILAMAVNQVEDLTAEFKRLQDLLDNMSDWSSSNMRDATGSGDASESTVQPDMDGIGESEKCSEEGIVSVVNRTELDKDDGKISDQSGFLVKDTSDRQDIEEHEYNPASGETGCSTQSSSRNPELVDVSSGSSNAPPDQPDTASAQTSGKSHASAVDATIPAVNTSTDSTKS